MPKTLLLADDSVTIQRVIELSFANEDIRVVSVGDGRRAINWMDDETPHVVLVDVEIPEVDGYAVAAHVKTSPRLKHVPVLLLAGAFEPVDDNRARAIGCDGVLVKPFEPQQLVSRVKALLLRADAGSGRKPGEESATITPFPGTHGVRGGDGGSAVLTAPARTVNTSYSEAVDLEPLEPPARPVWESTQAVAAATASAPVSRVAEPSSGGGGKVSLVNAFSALLAAEQSIPSAPAAAATPVTEATVEDAVKRVLVRMTDDLVRRIVLETAERLIREEIEKIKASPD
jgi:CheY-like chemotaxis protein